MAAAHAAPPLRVCADPNNLPFSNAAQQGFENRIAEILADELDTRLEYAWWPQRRGFIRHTLKAELCDLVIGVPAGYEMTATTPPYYRSSYVFVYRDGRGIDLHSFDDEALRSLKIGVHLMGDDYSNTPPAHALGRRGIVDNVAGFMIYGDYSQANPPARILEAVADGSIDVAIVWGPLAGYFAPLLDAALVIAPLDAAHDGPLLPMQYEISMGVRRGEPAFRTAVEGAIQRRRSDIDRVLANYNVPRQDAGAETDVPR